MEMLCDWVETVSHILDVNYSPWLRKAAPLAEEVESMKNEVRLYKAESASYQKKILLTAAETVNNDK